MLTHDLIPSRPSVTVRMTRAAVFLPHPCDGPFIDPIHPIDQ